MKRPGDFTILVVEDELELQTMLAEHLEDEGFHTVSASTGPDAMALAQSANPDLILLDVMVPGMSGFDICSVLRELPLTRTTPIIFLTAMADAARKSMGMRLGATDYITKPYKLREVSARVEQILCPTA